MSKAIQDIIAHRRHQVEVEGFGPEHDANYKNMELGYAGACYARPIYRDAEAKAENAPPIGWPFDRVWWKPTDRRADLVKAASLIVAEIEAIDGSPAALSVESMLNEHAKRLSCASREQIELARVFQRAAFDDGVQDGNSTRAEMVACPGTFIPAPLYLDLALKFSDPDWRAKLFAQLAVMQ